jgi:hypothetical protein
LAPALLAQDGGQGVEGRVASIEGERPAPAVLEADDETGPKETAQGSLGGRRLRAVAEEPEQELLLGAAAEDDRLVRVGPAVRPGEAWPRDALSAAGRGVATGRSGRRSGHQQVRSTPESGGGMRVSDFTASSGLGSGPASNETVVREAVLFFLRFTGPATTTRTSFLVRSLPVSA